MFRLHQETSEYKDNLIDATLGHVPFEGWTQKAVLAGAKDIGFNKNKAACAFPGQPIDLLIYHSNLADRRMADAVLELDLDNMKIRERIKAAIKIRLGAASNHKEALRSGLHLLASPNNTFTTLRLLYDTVDCIWFSIGDSSVDFNFYSKRALLGNVYFFTFLFWLNDKSEKNEHTWSFLDRRIEEVMKFQSLKNKFLPIKSPIRNFMEQLQEIAKNNSVYPDIGAKNL